MPENEKPIIFISHADEDKEIASALGTLIDDAFIGVIGHWFSSDKKPGGGIRPGTDSNQQIHDRLRGAEWAFALITPVSVKKTWVIWEAAIASQMCPGGVVPLVVGMKLEELPSPLNGFNGADGLDSKALCTTLQKIAQARDLSPNQDVLLQACKRFVNKVAPLTGTVKDAEAEILDDRGLVTKEDLEIFATRFEERLVGKIGRMVSPEPLPETKKATRADPQIETAARQAITLQDAGVRLEVDLIRSLVNKLWDSGDLEKALVLQEYLITAEHATAVDCYNLGILLQHTGRLNEQEDAYRKAVILDPRLAQGWYNLGVMFEDSGRMEEAEDAYTKAVTLDPNLSQGWYNLGGLLRSTGRMEKAKDAYTKAIELNPEFELAWNNLGVVLSHVGRMEEAEDAYRKAIRVNPKHANGWYNLGGLLQKTGRMEEAEDAYRKAAEIEPDSAERRNGLAYFLWEAGRPEEAETEVHQALRLDPDSSYAHATLGLLRLEKNDLGGGRKDYERAVELRSDDVLLRQKFRYEYGRALARNGRQEEARQEFKAGLKLDTDFVRKEIEAELEKLG